MIIFKSDIETESYIRAMRMLGGQVLPEVMAETLNDTAHAVTSRARVYMHRRHTIRRKFTTNSLYSARAKPYKMLAKALPSKGARMYSRAGTKSDYMTLQNNGATLKPKIGKRYPIAYQNTRTSKNPAKSISARYNLGNMGSIEDDGRYFIGTPRGGKRPLGMYERHANNKRLRLLRYLKESRVTITPTRWYSDALAEKGSDRLIKARFRRNAERRLKQISRRRR